VRPHDPSTLVRSDSHIPEWGRGIFFNHPQSRAQELPPSRVLGYGLHQDSVQPAIKKSTPRGRSATTNRSASRSASRRPWGSEWTVEPAEQGNGGLTNAFKAAQRVGDVEDIIWVGTVGFPTDSLEESIKDDIRDKLSADHDSTAVFVSDSDFEGHYSHFCKMILWPSFNYQIPDHPKSKAFEDHSWIYYRNLNQAFADKIVETYKRGDIIWIHDYHLLLVPAMVRKKLPDAKIGFFLHTAFPSSEVFRCLYVRNQLLEGMLGADLIAFQTHEYREHFLTTCGRLLTVEATENGVQLEDRMVNVLSMPIGIDPKGLQEALEQPEVAEYVDELKARYEGKKLIVARDKLDSIGGVRQKLLSFELFLNMYPEYKENVGHA
jgi:trehalose-6-phosphate synthase